MGNDRWVSRWGEKQIVWFCAAATILAVFLSDPTHASPQWRMIPFEIEGVKDAQVGAFALGADGTPWVIPAEPPRTICYWQDGVWHKLAGDAYWYRPDVSPTGDVYVCQHKSLQTGALYSLRDKRAVYVTDFSLDERTGRANLYFDTKGRIWNWGKSFVAKFENGQWERVPAQAGEFPGIIEDGKGNVYFFGTTLSYYRDGRFTTDSNLPSPMSKVTGSRPCLWGEDKALFIWDREVFAVDLNSLQASFVIRRQPSQPTRQFYDPFRDREGNVWLLTADHPNYPERYYTVLSAQDGTVLKKPETAAIEWADNRKTEHWRSVLCATDGTIYFGAPGNGVYIYQGGKFTHTDWRDGLAMNSTNMVYEHPDGTIWFASHHTGITVYDPKGEQTSPPPGFRDTWTQFDLRNRLTVRDFNDRVCACLAGQPGRVSWWNGSAWTQIDVPFDPKGMSEWLIDNLGSMYFMVQEGGRKNVYQIRNGNLERFQNIRSALAEAVKEGATEFRSSDPFHQATAPIITKAKHIWSQTERLQGLMWYDGQRWDGEGRSVEAFIKYKDDQVLARDNAGWFYTLAQGKMTRFDNEHLQRSEYLLSEVGKFPFDEDAYREGKGRLFPMCLSALDGMFICRDPNELHQLGGRKAPRGTPGFGDPREIWLAKGGFWHHITTKPELVRYCDGLVLMVDWTKTPLGAYLQHADCDVYEEKNADLWIRDQMKLFRIRRGLLDTRITSPLAAECRSRRVEISFAGTRDGQEDAQLTFAWRLDGGSWSAPAQQRSATVEFSKSGAHTFEVVSVGELGNVDTTPAVLKLNAVLPTP